MSGATSIARRADIAHRWRGLKGLPEWKLNDPIG